MTLTATPEEGYALGTLTVTDRFGDAVKVTENADGTYTFTMPNGQVTVKATFVETEEPAPPSPLLTWTRTTGSMMKWFTSTRMA